MSGSGWRLRSWAVSISVALAIGFPAAEPARAQTGRDKETDLLEEARRLDQIAAQKLEADIRTALRDVQMVAPSKPAKAVELLQRTLARLQEDTTLSPERRRSLTRMLQDRIRVIEADAEAAAQSAAQQKDKDSKTSARRIEEQQRTEEAAQIGNRLNRVKELHDQGKTEEAWRQARDLAQQHTQSAPARAADHNAQTIEHLTTDRRLQREREQSWVGAQQDLVKSNTLTGNDMEFPKDWKERTKGRTTTLQLTTKERSILHALNTTISVSFKDSKLDSVIEYLQTYVGQPILLDRESLRDLEVSYDTPITFNVKGTTLRTVLRRILGDLGLTYVIKEETIQVTSAQRAKELMVVRRYYVGDLLANMGALGNLASSPAHLSTTSALQGPVVNPWNGVPTAFWNLGGVQVSQPVNPQLQALQNMQNMKQVADQLIELIQSSVETQSWREHGGNGTITFHAPSMSLLIKQSAEVHALLGNGSSVK